MSRLDRFFEAVAAEAADLRVLRGELRWSYGYTWTLQGTHATRARLKRRNSGVELLLTRLVEPLEALVSLMPGSRFGSHRAIVERASDGARREIRITPGTDTFIVNAVDPYAVAILPSYGERADCGALMGGPGSPGGTIRSAPHRRPCGGAG